MGQDVMAYEPNMPEPTEDPAVDVSKYPMQLVELTVLPDKRGWSRFKISLPQNVRQRYIDDVVYGQEWRDLLQDFDKQLLGSTCRGKK